MDFSYCAQTNQMCETILFLILFKMKKYLFEFKLFAQFYYFMSKDFKYIYLCKRTKLAELINLADGFGWLDSEEKKILNSMLDNDTLKFGIIGQIKSGKSTFLNAFIFKDFVLPVEVDTMTASLCYITNGSPKSIEVEFYSKEEWKEFELLAKMSVDSASNDKEVKRISSAKELMNSSSILGASLNSYLGTKKADTFENLKEYVGKSGRFVCITKSVKLLYPQKNLENIIIADTPGFDDPVVFREEKTKEFLKDADAVLLLVSGDCPFKEQEEKLIIDAVTEYGVGKIFVVVNKYDVMLEDGIDEIDKYLQDKIEETANKVTNQDQKEEILKIKPIYLSAGMALLSMLPIEKIESDENLLFYKDRYCEIFNISSQEQMREKSRFEEINSQICSFIEKDKEETLIRKPVNIIRNIYMKKRTRYTQAISICRESLRNLKSSKEELEKKKTILNSLIRQANDKYMCSKKSITVKMRDISSEGRSDLRSSVKSFADSLIEKVNNLGRTDDREGFISQMNLELDFFFKVTLNKEYSNIIKRAKANLKSELLEFFDSLKRINGIDQITDISDFVNNLSNEFSLLIDQQDTFSYVKKEFNVDCYNFILFRLFNLSNVQSELRLQINSLVRDFNPEISFKLKKNGQEIHDILLERIKTEVIDDYLSPIQRDLENTINGEKKQEQERKNKEQEVSKLLKDQMNLEKQIKDFEEAVNKK